MGAEWPYISAKYVIGVTGGKIPQGEMEGRSDGGSVRR